MSMEDFLYGGNDTDGDVYGLNGTEWDNGTSGRSGGLSVEWSAARIQRVITLSVLMTVSFIGNSVIIFILFCSRYHKQLNRVKIFIINLAIGDLAVCCITMSSELMFEIFQEWKLGNAGCKIITYTQIVTLSSTTYILMGMSWDRYKAICRPLDFNPSPTKARRIVAAAWIAALILAIPNLFIYVQVEHIYKDGTSVFYCHSAGYTADWQKKVNFIWLTCSALILPAFWIAYCYFSVARVVWQQGNCQQLASGDGFTLLRKTCDIRVIPRAKIKTMKMSLTIVITFVVCWTPYFVVYNIRVFSDYKFSIPESLMVLADTLALMNSAVNPIIYGCFNLRIRQGLQEACCFNLNVHSDKSQLSEPSCSTSSTARVRTTVRRPNGNHGHPKRNCPATETEFEFVQSTRHIQNKRLRENGQRYRHAALTFGFCRKSQPPSSTNNNNGSRNNNHFHHHHHRGGRGTTTGTTTLIAAAATTSPPTAAAAAIPPTTLATATTATAAGTATGSQQVQTHLVCYELTSPAARHDNPIASTFT